MLTWRSGRRGEVQGCRGMRKSTRPSRCCQPLRASAEQGLLLRLASLGTGSQRKQLPWQRVRTALPVAAAEGSYSKQSASILGARARNVLSAARCFGYIQGAQRDQAGVTALPEDRVPAGPRASRDASRGQGAGQDTASSRREPAPAPLAGEARVVFARRRDDPLLLLLDGLLWQPRSLFPATEPQRICLASEAGPRRGWGGCSAWLARQGLQTRASAGQPRRSRGSVCRAQTGTDGCQARHEPGAPALPGPPPRRWQKPPERRGVAVVIAETPQDLS